MSAINSNYSASTLDNQGLQGELTEIRKDLSKSLQDYITNLGTIIGDSSNIQGTAPILQSPDLSVISAADLTVKIALIQDALNQLQQQVSKLEIEGRLNDLEKNNADQLKKIQEQIKEAEEAQRKQAEANKKSNIFDAIGKFFKAVFDIVSAVFSAVAAVGYLFTNPVAAFGLATAALALAASGICNLVLAIDATIIAAGGEGFLSDKHKANLEKAAEICGYIALAAGALSGLAVITGTLRTAVGTAASELAKHGIQATKMEIAKQVAGAMKDAIRDLGKEAFGKLTNTTVKSITKEAAEVAAQQAILIAIRSGGQEAAKTAAKEAVDVAIRAAIREAVKQTYGPLFNSIARLTLATTVMQSSVKIADSVHALEIASMEEQIAAHQKKADDAEADAKAFQALITMLRAMIEQLQKDLEEMIESSMETVQAIFDAADDSQQSMKDLFHMQAN